MISGLLASSLVGNVTARALTCDFGEVVHLTAPSVTVVDGPGDETQEIARWAELSHAYIEGTTWITFGRATFDFERVE